jgi:hypothetical protein
LKPVDQIWKVGGEELEVPQFPVVVKSAATAVNHKRQNVVSDNVVRRRRLTDERRKLTTGIVDGVGEAVVEPDV